MTGKPTFHVVAYDVTDDRRRERLRKWLRRYGDAVQKSVFECVVTRSQLADLRKGVAALIDPSEDSVRYYEVCGGCLRSIDSIGSMPRPIPKPVVIV